MATAADIGGTNKKNTNNVNIHRSTKKKYSSTIKSLDLQLKSIDLKKRIDLQ